MRLTDEELRQMVGDDCAALNNLANTPVAASAPSGRTKQAIAVQSGTPRQKPRQIEHEMQCAVVETIALYATQRPDLELLYAVPNGGHRHVSVAVALKAEGVRSGVPDLCLPVARGGYHGLHIEMKTPKGRISPDQAWWIERLRRAGYRVEVCYSVDAAVDVILSYERGV